MNPATDSIASLPSMPGESGHRCHRHAATPHGAWSGYDAGRPPREPAPCSTHEGGAEAGTEVSQASRGCGVAAQRGPGAECAYARPESWQPSTRGRRVWASGPGRRSVMALTRELRCGGPGAVAVAVGPGQGSGHAPGAQWATGHHALTPTGVTVLLRWQDSTAATPAGWPYRWCGQTDRAWASQLDRVRRPTHRAGETLGGDDAGQRLPVVNRPKGWAEVDHIRQTSKPCNLASTAPSRHSTE